MSYRWIPNALTSLRIAGALALLAVEPISAGFYIVYLICGISDVLDGFFARLLHCTSDFGAKLDSISDILFYAVMLVRLFPILWIQIPRAMWLWVGLILVVRIMSYVVAYIRFRTFASLHTWLNKLTGFTVFLIPFFLNGQYVTEISRVVCLIGFAASSEELIMHLSAEAYDPRSKGLLTSERMDRKKKNI